MLFISIHVLCFGADSDKGTAPGIFFTPLRDRAFLDTFVNFPREYSMDLDAIINLSLLHFFKPLSLYLILS